MKKMIMALALIAGLVASASTDVYTFKTSLRYPAIGKTAFVPATSPLAGTLTVVRGDDATNTTATLEVTLKKTKETYTLVADQEQAFVVFGKKDTDVATSITFTNTADDPDGILELTFSGFGTLKTKTTGGCTPCGDTTETCSKVTKLSGNVQGFYACPCSGQFVAWDGGCELDLENEDADYSAIYGTGTTFTLKTVDGQRWK